MNKFFLQLKQYNSKGFTLIEVLVVLGLFSSIMTIAAGALFTTQAINTKLQETQSILDNVNLSMETMTREIRYGSAFHCDITLQAASSTLRKSCTYANQGGTVLFFKPNTMTGDSDRVVYYASSTNGILYKDEYVDGATTTYQITGDDVSIKSLVFYVTGANTATSTTKDVDNFHDDTQPLITLTLAGETKPTKKTTSSASSSQPVKFTVQTSISSRELDN